MPERCSVRAPSVCVRAGLAWQLASSEVRLAETSSLGMNRWRNSTNGNVTQAYLSMRSGAVSATRRRFDFFGDAVANRYPTSPRGRLRVSFTAWTMTKTYASAFTSRAGKSLSLSAPRNRAWPASYRNATGLAPVVDGAVRFWKRCCANPIRMTSNCLIRKPMRNDEKRTAMDWLSVGVLSELATTTS